jgi:hypothetical protein
LCDELLQAQVMRQQVQRVFETIRSLGCSTAVVSLRS